MTLRRLRHLLLTLTLAGFAGTGAELLLLEHTEGVAQKVPLAGMTLGAICIAWYWRRPGPASRLAQRGAMVGLLAVAVTGLSLHFDGNREFELELHPAASGADLIWESLRGATPVLAPGALAVLACLGLLATARPLDPSEPAS